MNAIKDAIKSGRTVVGTTVTPDIDVSILAAAGYDFLLFDTQHSAWEIKQLRPSIETMRGKQAAPVVRVAVNQAHLICFALDAGARGIVVPMVNTQAEAEAACAPAAIIRLATAATLVYAASGASSRITAITSMP